MITFTLYLSFLVHLKTYGSYSEGEDVVEGVVLSVVVVAGLVVVVADGVVVMGEGVGEGVEVGGVEGEVGGWVVVSSGGTVVS